MRTVKRIMFHYLGLIALVFLFTSAIAWGATHSGFKWMTWTGAVAFIGLMIYLLCKEFKIGVRWRAMHTQ